jgi:type I restriction enzyme, S subunit
MSFPRYESYRDSNSEWLGEVPDYWAIVALKRTFEIVGGSTPSSEVEACWGEGYVWITPADLGKIAGRYISQSERTITKQGLESCSSSLVPVGSIVLSTRAPIGSLGIARVELCTNQGCKSLVPGPDSIASYYAFLLSIMTDELQIRGKGTTFLEISADVLGSVEIPKPPVEEQMRIGEFLEAETGKIDALIEEQRRLIESLMEKRQAVISHAVTKGLDASCRMKPSGVGWLGNIPVSWGIAGSRRLFRVRNERARESDQQLTASQKYGMLFQTEFMELEGRRVVEVIQGTDSLRHAEPDDFVISLRSFQGGIEWCKLAGSVTFHYVVLVPIKDVYPPFFAYLFKSMAYIQALRSTTNLIRDGQDLRFSHFVLIDLPLVPLDEQREIAAYLDQKIPQIDALRAQAFVAIGLLQERRSALISAAVTGKIDVRNHTPKEAA